MFNINNKNLTATLCVVALSGLLMGNQKCQQEPVETRQLKKNVKVIAVEASSFMNNSGFNFSEVAQSQLSGVLFEDKNFYERNTYPAVEGRLENFPNVNGKIVQQVSNIVVVDDKSLAQMKTWFPTMKASEIDLSSNSSCLISRPQHLLYGKINALEAWGGGKLQFGFNQTATPQIPISAKFALDKMRMDLSFSAIDPWTMQKVAAVNSEIFKKDYSAGFGIDLGIIHIGPEFYRVTGMAEVTLKGLKQSVKDLAQALLGVQRQEWQSRVMISRDNYVVIVGGAELGLKKGDQLKIENEVHDWMGEPCSETGVLLGSVSVTQDPWIVEIEDAGNLMSKAKVLNPREDESIEVGALTRVHKLYVDPQIQAPKQTKKK
ncbi:MAG: hypothetical protein ACK4VO_09315 [Pseudobdellovibrio sp.]